MSQMMLPMDHVEAPVIREVLTRWKTEDTVVLVAGAYQGATVAFVRKYSPRASIIAAEPQEWCVNILHERFESDPRVTVLAAGLGLSDGMKPMYETGNDACSFLPLAHARTKGAGMMLDARGLFGRWPRINFFICNMEGAEWTLLPYLADHLLYTTVLVQEHFGIPDEPVYAEAWWGQKKRQEIGAGWALYE